MPGWAAEISKWAPPLDAGSFLTYRDRPDARQSEIPGALLRKESLACCDAIA